MIGFKTPIVTSNNVAPSIFWLIFAGTGLRLGGGGIVFHSVKALIISALLVLVAWLRWKANTGSPPLPSRTLSIEGGSVPGLNAGGPFSWKRLGHYRVSGALTIWRHIYKAFTCLTKAQTELRPKTPLFTCFLFFFFFFKLSHVFLKKKQKLISYKRHEIQVFLFHTSPQILHL